MRKNKLSEMHGDYISPAHEEDDCKGVKLLAYLPDEIIILVLKSFTEKEITKALLQIANTHWL